MGFEVYRAIGEGGWGACSLSGRTAVGNDHGYDGGYRETPKTTCTSVVGAGSRAIAETPITRLWTVTIS
jgi:hypothetical protein